MADTSTTDRQNKRLRVLPVVAAAVCCAAAVTASVYAIRGGQYEIDEAAMSGTYEMTVAPQVRELAQEMARRQEAARNSTVEIQINGAPQADAVTGRCNLMAGNPEGNAQDLRITVTLDEDGQIIYRSQVLKPGERAAYAVLDQIPEPGEYPATAEFVVLDPETGEAVGAVDAGLFLTVE